MAYWLRCSEGFHFYFVSVGLVFFGSDSPFQPFSYQYKLVGDVCQHFWFGSWCMWLDCVLGPLSLVWRLLFVGLGLGFPHSCPMVKTVEPFL